MNLARAASRYPDPCSLAGGPKGLGPRDRRPGSCVTGRDVEGGIGGVEPARSSSNTRPVTLCPASVTSRSARPLVTRREDLVL